MVRRAAAFVLTLAVGGCSVFDEPVPLLTGERWCYAGGETGVTARLLADAESGTRFDGIPVMWPPGYTAHRAGAEIVVVDAVGMVKATTGRTYHISHAWAPSLGMGDDSAFVAAVDCGYAWDFVDCTASPDNQYCTKP